MTTSSDNPHTPSNESVERARLATTRLYADIMRIGSTGTPYGRRGARSARPPHQVQREGARPRKRAARHIARTAKLHVVSTPELYRTPAPTIGRLITQTAMLAEIALAMQTPSPQESSPRRNLGRRRRRSWLRLGRTPWSLRDNRS